MRKLLLALAASLALVAGFIVATPAAQAKDVTFVQGLLNGEFGAYQVFDVSRVPSVPTCTSGAPTENFKVTVKTAQGGAPSSGANAGVVDLSNRYIKFFESSDADYPWGIRLYQVTDDKELRYDSVSRAWVTDANAAFATAKPFSEGGNIVAANEKGFLHISKETGTNWAGGYGTFVSITLPRVPAEVITYTPAADMNNCTTFYTPKAANSGNDSNTGPVIKLDSTKTMYVPDYPLGPATDDATIKSMKVSAGELEGQVKADVKSYNWGVATTGTDSLMLMVYPTNSAATVRIGNVTSYSGVPFTGITVSPGQPNVLTLNVTSMDGTKTDTYTVTLTAYPTNVMPTIEKIEPTSASSEGGTLVKITGKGFTFAKGVVLTPDGDIYSPRAVSAKKVILTLKHPKLLKGEFRVINHREIEVMTPAAPNPAGGYYTGDYGVIVDTPFANSKIDPLSGNTSLRLLVPQKPTSKLDWAKKLIVPGLTKLLGLPIKMNSGQAPKFKVLVKFFGRSKPAGDASLYTVIRKSDGVYIDMKTSQKAQVTTVVTAKGTSKYAPYYNSKVLTSK